MYPFATFSNTQTDMSHTVLPFASFALFCSRIRHDTGESDRQNSAFPGVLGNGITSRMFAMPVAY